MIGMGANLPVPTFDDVCAAKYVLLTTYTKDGRAKPAAVWAAPEDGELLVWTETTSWKVRRIRNTPRVTLAVCDVRGKVRSGEIEGTARVLDPEGTERARAAITGKYGLLGWVLVKASVLRRGSSGTIGLAVTA
ncbi:PPOX class F420-dependent oxidoreductase [Mycobacteroides salmoniphilum]|uniref:PPOX class F420-dependent oxidoreductase n=1 Tax=Mycobacteroides salmoniphilum TaxID=404941 RepID=UPI0009924B4B|nr:PPOX class F420-dependent oxidoreductase [Mycobacteroides salmoniphilum]